MVAKILVTCEQRLGRTAFLVHSTLGVMMKAVRGVFVCTVWYGNGISEAVINDSACLLSGSANWRRPPYWQLCT